MKPLIISIDRQFGSGGRDIARLLEKRFDIPYYHHRLLKEIGIHSSYDLDEIRDLYDEAPRTLMRTRRIKGLVNSNAENIAQKEFEFLRNLAKEGKSFIVIGHCSEEILKEYGVISIFITGDEEFKIERTMKKFDESREEAIDRMKRFDKKRKTYHNYYANTKWGDVRNYDITMNSSRLGVEQTADFLADYIEKRLQES
jgi:cytidylate kinase